MAFNVDSLQKELGGTAGNIAYTLKLLEDNPYIVGTAGKDFLVYQQFLSELGLNTKHIKVLENDGRNTNNQRMPSRRM